MSSNEYMREYMARRYRERMDRAIERLGGKCVDCGDTENLEFDHIDPASRVDDVSQLVTYSDEKFWTEVDKCQLRCRDCHERRTALQAGNTPAQGTHGTLSSYRYCKCELCRAAKSEANKQYYRNKRAGVA